MAAPDSSDPGISSNISSNTSSRPAPRPSWEAAPPRPAPPARRPEPREPASPFTTPAAAYPPPAAAPAYEAPLETDVKYDLAGNPIPGSGQSAPASSSLPASAPYGYSAAPATSGTWPPPVGSAGYGAQAYRNNSGEQGHLPPEIERLRWHWGAFFFPIFWTRKHGLTTVASVLAGGLLFLRVLRYIFAAINPSIVLLIWGIYGVAYLSLQVYGGLNGHKIGWRNRHFPGGVEEYFKVQSAWMWWGFGINLLLVPMLWFLFFAAIVGTALTGHQPVPSAYGDYGNNSYGNNSYGNNSYGNNSYGSRPATSGQ